MNELDRETRKAVRELKMYRRTANKYNRTIRILSNEDDERWNSYCPWDVLGDERWRVLLDISDSMEEVVKFYEKAIWYTRKMDVEQPTFQLHRDPDSQYQWLGTYWYGERWDAWKVERRLLPLPFGRGLKSYLLLVSADKVEEYRSSQMGLVGPWDEMRICKSFQLAMHLDRE